MENKYFVGKPKILNEALFKKRVDDILATGIYSNVAHYSIEVENFVESLLDVNNAVLLSNATVGLEAVLHYLRLKNPFGQILVPSFTFIASVNSILRSGFDPLFVDIDDDYCMSPEDALYKLNPNVVGAMCVNLFGNVCDHHQLSQLGVPLIYDSAHAVGVYDEAESRYVGGSGLAEVMSFHPTKLISGFSGGVVTTKDYELAKFLKRYRNFGFEYNSGQPQGEYTNVIGSNCKLDEISAAAILCQLECREDIQSHYFDNFVTYKNHLPEWARIMEPNQVFSNFSYIIIRVHGAFRNQLVEYLMENGIHARTYFQPVHKTAAYKERFGHLVLPNTERLAAEVIALPTGLTISQEDVVKICGIIDRFGQ